MVHHCECAGVSNPDHSHWVWPCWGKKVIGDDPDVNVGKGLAIIQQGSGLPGLDSANASVTLLNDGTFMLLSGGTDMGTGLRGRLQGNKVVPYWSRAEIESWVLAKTPPRSQWEVLREART